MLSRDGGMHPAKRQAKGSSSPGTFASSLRSTPQPLPVAEPGLQGGGTGDPTRSPSTHCTPTRAFVAAGAQGGPLGIPVWGTARPPRSGLQQEPSQGQGDPKGTRRPPPRSLGHEARAGRAAREQPPRGVLIVPELYRLKIGCQEWGGGSRADATYCVSEQRRRKRN